MEPTLEDQDARLKFEIRDVREADAFGRQLTIEVAAGEVDARVNEAISDLRRDLALPGFRKGKVPRSVIEARFGEDVREEVVKKVVEEAMWQAVGEQDLHPIGDPQVRDLSHENDGPLSFTVHLDVRPKIELKDPAEIKVEKVVYPIEDESVERVLDGMRNRMAKLEPVERGAEPGDVVTADVSELGAGYVPIVGRRRTDVRFELAEGEIPAPWIEAIRGRRAGETATVELPQPEAGEGELPRASAPRYYLFELRQLESKELPELDEAFATQMGAESLDALRSHVQASLKAEDDRRANREVEQQILDRLAAGIELEIPSRILNPIADRLFERGVREMPDLDEGGRERLAVEARQAALADVRRELVIAAVAQNMRIEVSQREAEEEYRELERLERTSREPRSELTGSQRAERIERLRELLVERKVLKYLVDTADVQVVHQSSKRKRIVTPYDP